MLLKTAGAADKVPGFDIALVSLHPHTIFSFGFDGFTVCRIDKASLLQIAGFLDDCAATSGEGGKSITFTDEAKGLIVARFRRHAVKVIGTDLLGGIVASRTLTLDIARDLAAQIRRSING